jgi:uncharacterized protein YndB with AHSA1/START domain
MTSETTLRIERIIDASPEVVFRAWTTPDAIAVWYQDRPDDVVRVVELDVRVGGRYCVEFGPPGEAPYIESGVYLEIDPPNRLVMNETLDAPSGRPWSDTTVTVTLDAHDGKTRLVLVHENFPSVEERDAANGGWPGFLDRIEQLVVGQAAP